MGVDAYIKMVRIADGLHLLPDKAPVFKVTEPIAIIPLFCELIHGLNGSATMITTRDGHVDSALYLRLMYSPVYLWDELRYGHCDGEPDPVFGIVLAPLTDYEHRLEPAVREGKAFHDLGGLEYHSLKKEWAEIIPGYWCVIDYHVCGSSHDVEWRYNLPKECQITKTVDFKIWT